MVIATISDAKSETMNVIPSGFSIRPSRSSRRNNGKKVIIMIIVAFSMDDLISEEALNITSITGALDAGSFAMFLLSCL